MLRLLLLLPVALLPFTAFAQGGCGVAGVPADPFASAPAPAGPPRIVLDEGLELPPGVADRLDAAASLAGLSGDVGTRLLPGVGLYQLSGAQGAVHYATPDGRHLLPSAQLVEVESGTNLTEVVRSAQRLALFQQADTSTFIDLPPEPGSFGDADVVEVVVFTDVDCPFSQQLHDRRAEYGAYGVHLRYAAFPRASPGTATWQRSERVWCALDPDEGLDLAMMGDYDFDAPPCDSPVGGHHALASSLGVSATPTLLLPNGSLLPGYLPPEALYQAIQRDAALALR